MSKKVTLTDEEYLSLPRKLEILDGKLLISPEGMKVLRELICEDLVADGQEKPSNI